MKEIDLKRLKRLKNLIGSNKFQLLDKKESLVKWIFLLDKMDGSIEIRNELFGVGIYLDRQIEIFDNLILLIDKKIKSNQ